MSKPRAVVVGGGIAGLSAAFEFHRAGWDVTVYEASDRWGGKVHSSPVGDRLVDAGPDAFLARVPYGHDLCVELGLDHLLTSPVAAVPAYVYADGELHELPTATMLGVPTDLDALRRSDLISPAGIDRAAQDLTMGPSSLESDPSVGAICRERLGDEVTDRLIDPLIGAINASDIDRLSLAAAAPQLKAGLEADGSLIDGMATLREKAGAALGSRDPDKPVFYGLPGGTAQIIDRLVEELADASLHLSTAITDLTEIGGADAIVLAVPAFAAAAMIGSDSEPGKLLGDIHYADVSQVVVELPISGLDMVLDASGILFPRVDGRVLTACTWLSTKWDHYRRPESVLIRLSSGRYGDDRHATFSDAELTAVLLDEMAAVTGATPQPIATRVVRWTNAFPQYTPGHRDRVEALRQSLAEHHPSVAVIGAPYDGIGVPACIAGGRDTAKAIMDR